jgi:hypothetical protein
MFWQLYHERGIKLVGESIVYFHYGVVNAIGTVLDRVRREPFPVTTRTMQIATEDFSKDLAIANFYVEEEKAQLWLNPLITSIAKIKEVKLHPEARDYLNRLIILTSRVILNRAGEVATMERPDIMLIFLEDLENACRSMFPRKNWFIC